MVWLMSDTTPAAATTPTGQTPPGWYDDGTGSGRMRWWSGVEWTEHVAAPYSMGAPVRPALPADRPVYSVWIWLIVLLPLLSYASYLLWQPNFDYLSDPSALSSVSGFESGYLMSVFSPGYFVILFGGWVMYGLMAVFAWRDAVWLRAQGVVRPFAWPWVFLGSAVYVIGRSVIVRRVAAPRGLAPIWGLIAVMVVGFIVVAFWMVSIMSGVASNLPDYSGQYTG
jgi:Protein of unknown function (DUF2510)